MEGLRNGKGGAHNNKRNQQTTRPDTQTFKCNQTYLHVILIFHGQRQQQIFRYKILIWVKWRKGPRISFTCHRLPYLFGALPITKRTTCLECSLVASHPPFLRLPLYMSSVRRLHGQLGSSPYESLLPACKAYLDDAKHVLDGQDLFGFQLRGEGRKQIVHCCHLRVGWMGGRN